MDFAFQINTAAFNLNLAGGKLGRDLPTIVPNSVGGSIEFDYFSGG